jgi:hypothetical protein
MNVQTEQSGGVSIVRVADTRVMYPMLSDFAAPVRDLVGAGRKFSTCGAFCSRFAAGCRKQQASSLRSPDC